MKTARKIVNIAYVGCGHGELNKIYSSIQKLNVKVDLLIIGGDFQAVRNMTDLNCMSVPPKYRKLGDFADYYAGRKTAPVTTVFIGGNHEASNYLWELFYGGWVANNIYYMGAANVINFKGVRIGGLSGIWHESDYYKGHFERLPYDNSTLRSIYHIRQCDVRKLFNVTGRVDIMLSHDWPAGIEQYGDVNDLLRKKKHFEADVRYGELGSPPAMALLKKLRPRTWLSAHLHVKFAAIVPHIDSNPAANNPKDPQQLADANEDEISLDLGNGDEIDIGIDMAIGGSNDPNLAGASPGSATNLKGREMFGPGAAFPQTRFLALDKCLPNRKFLQVIPISVDDESAIQNDSLAYDPEWLAITKAMAPYMPLVRADTITVDAAVISQELDKAREWVFENVCQKNKLSVPLNFERTAPIVDVNAKTASWQPSSYFSKQTQEFCDLVGIPNTISSSPQK